MTNTYELLLNQSQTLQGAGLYNGQVRLLIIVAPYGEKSGLLSPCLCSSGNVDDCVEKRNEDGSWPRQT